MEEMGRLMKKVKIILKIDRIREPNPGERKEK